MKKPRTRPQARPLPEDDSVTGMLESESAVSRAIRPVARPERIIDLPSPREWESSEKRRNKSKGSSKTKAKKMAAGGMCRGMGAATRGGKYKAT